VRGCKKGDPVEFDGYFWFVGRADDLIKLTNPTIYDLQLNGQ